MAFAARRMRSPPSDQSPTTGHFALRRRSPSSDKSSTTEERTDVQTKLSQKPGPEYLKIRENTVKPAEGVVLMEEWQLINLANEVFGFNGWSSNVISLTTDYIERDESSGLYDIGVTAIVRVALIQSHSGTDGDSKDGGVYHDGDGYYTVSEKHDRGVALTECKRRAVSNALRRALGRFGNLMGNCLHDKTYTDGILAMEKPFTSFNESELYRRKDFASSASHQGPSDPTILRSSPDYAIGRASSPLISSPGTGGLSEAVVIPSGPQAATMPSPSIRALRRASPPRVSPTDMRPSLSSISERPSQSSGLGAINRASPPGILSTSGESLVPGVASSPRVRSGESNIWSERVEPVVSELSSVHLSMDPTPIAFEGLAPLHDGPPRPSNLRAYPRRASRD